MQKDKWVEDIAKVDWEFVNADTRYMTHDFHPFSSKFIPQIARNLVTIFSSPGDIVLDNFCGSGTTLVECRVLGRNSIGVDINPLACLISKVKVTSISPNGLYAKVNSLLQNISAAINSYRLSDACTKGQYAHLFSGFSRKAPHYELPSFDKRDKWFQPQVLAELAIVKEYIKKLEDSDFKDFALVALSAIIRSVSNASSDYGNLMIDRGKKQINDTFERFQDQLKKMIFGMNKFTKQANNEVFSRVILGDSRNLCFVNEDSIDLIIAHPPYIAAVPYAEYQKLSLLWLYSCFYDYLSKKFPEEYVINLKPTALDKNIMGGERRRENLVKRFHSDMLQVFVEMWRVLKPDRFCCVVIGNPFVKGKKIPLNETLVEQAKGVGFSFQREIARGKYQTTMGKMKEEYILVFQKT